MNNKWISVVMVFDGIHYEYRIDGTLVTVSDSPLSITEILGFTED